MKKPVELLRRNIFRRAVSNNAESSLRLFLWKKQNIQVLKFSQDVGRPDFNETSAFSHVDPFRWTEVPYKNGDRRNSARKSVSFLYHVEKMHVFQFVPAVFE
jgi:hypothetical protein